MNAGWGIKTQSWEEENKTGPPPSSPERYKKGIWSLKREEKAKINLLELELELEGFRK